MPKKKDKPRPKIRFLDLDKYLGNPSLVGEVKKEEEKDELDEALKNAAKRKVQKLKMMELDKYLLETEKELKKLEETESEGKEAPMTTGSLVTGLIQGGMDPKVVNEWLKSLDPQALGALVALQSNNPMLAMLAFGMSSQKKSESLTVKEVLELNKATAGTQPNITLDIAKLVEVASGAGKPSQAGISAKEIVDSTLTAVQTGIALASGGKEKEESWFDKLMSTPEGLKTAREIGLFGGNPDYLRLQKEIRDADRKFARDMKADDRRWQVQLQKMRDESRRMWAEAQEQKRRTELAKSTLKRIGGAIARAVSEGEEGEAAEAKPAPKKKGNVRSLGCPECGAEISIPPNSKVGGKVTCASCNSEFELTE